MEDTPIGEPECFPISRGTSEEGVIRLLKYLLNTYNEDGGEIELQSTTKADDTFIIGAGENSEWIQDIVKEWNSYVDRAANLDAEEYGDVYSVIRIHKFGDTYKINIKLYVERGDKYSTKYYIPAEKIDDVLRIFLSTGEICDEEGAVVYMRK